MKNQIAVMAAVAQGCETQKEVADVTGLSLVGVRSAERELEAKFGVVLNNGELRQHQRHGLYGMGVFAGAAAFKRYLKSVDLEYFRKNKQLPDY